jgi:hypothetical protein
MVRRLLHSLEGLIDQEQPSFIFFNWFLQVGFEGDKHCELHTVHYGVFSHLASDTRKILDDEGFGNGSL